MIHMGRFGSVVGYDRRIRARGLLWDGRWLGFVKGKRPRRQV